MRLRQKLDVVLKFVLVEIGILLIIGVVFYFQYDKAKEEFVTKTQAIAETIGEQASSYFSDYGKEPSSDEFYMFLDQRLGSKKLFNTFEVSPKFFSVLFSRDIEKIDGGGYFMKDMLTGDGVSVRKDKGLISVAVPFMTPQSSSVPSGIVRIDSDTKTLLKKVFSDNFLLYAAMLVVLNNQAFILYLFTRRKKEVVFDKGYLKDHSIGALKIMHRVLGDIIEDHATQESRQPGSAQTDPGQEQKSSEERSREIARNVISISRLASNKKEE